MTARERAVMVVAAAAITCSIVGLVIGSHLLVAAGSALAACAGFTLAAGVRKDGAR